MVSYGVVAQISVPFLLINSRLINNWRNLETVILIDTMSENMLSSFQSFSVICRGAVIF